MPNTFNTKLSELLQTHISKKHLDFPIVLPLEEFAKNLAAETDISVEEAKGYTTAFFDTLNVLGAVAVDTREARFADEINAAMAIALSLSVQDGVNHLFDFTDSEDVENPYYGSWLLYNLENRRADYNPDRTASRVCEHLVVLVKAKMGDQEAILLQHEGKRAWSKYKLIGGRLRSVDKSDPVKAAIREIKQEVRTKRMSAENIRVSQLSREPFEYTVLSRRLGAYTLYKCHVMECELDLPEGSLTESFQGEKGRETTWFPVDEVNMDNDAIAQKDILKWILDNRWTVSAKVSTNQTVQAGGASLRKFISKHFNVSELKDLCFELDVDFENLSGEGKEGKVISLIQHFERHNRLDELEKKCKELRPNA